MHLFSVDKCDKILFPRTFVWMMKTKLILEKKKKNALQSSEKCLQQIFTLINSSFGESYKDCRTAKKHLESLDLLEKLVKICLL